MSGLNKFFMACAWLLLLASAVAVVWTKHQTRSAFVALQKLKHERDQLNTEWGQLRLEQGTWISYGRIEKKAREDLHMVVPSPSDVRIIEP